MLRRLMFPSPLAWRMSREEKVPNGLPSTSNNPTQWLFHAPAGMLAAVLHPARPLDSDRVGVDRISLSSVAP